MITLEDILKNFPFSPRENQKEIFERILKPLNDPLKKFIILQAPTGTGKSAIAMALAKIYDSAYIVTLNKFLQDQYQRDFSQTLFDMRGRSNYACYNFKGFNCSDSPCRGNKTLRGMCGKANPGTKIETPCEYHEVLQRAQGEDIISFNFAAALAFLNYTPYFNKRKLMIIDEAHLMEDYLTGFGDLVISGFMASKFKLPKLPKELMEEEDLRLFHDWLSNVSEKLKEYEDEDIKKLPKGVRRESYESLVQKVKSIINKINVRALDFVVQVEKDPKGQNQFKKISFRPLSVDKIAKNNLYCYADKIIMMSATIGDPEVFRKTLGIREDEMEFIDVPSVFPVENRPIIDASVGSLNYKNISKKFPEIIEEIKYILEDHSNEKGIIFTSSYRMSSDIYDELYKNYGERIIYPETSAKQLECIQKHADSKGPTVLISPSMAEGVDLKEDLSRFQIITKAMFPSLADKLTVARKDRQPGWYEMRTLLKVIQAYGRSVRSETDTACTYILDENIYKLINRFKSSLPTYFLDAVFEDNS